MATGPRRDYLHARLPAKQAAHVVRLQAASATGPSGHALNAVNECPPHGGCHCHVARCPFPLVARL